MSETTTKREWRAEGDHVWTWWTADQELFARDHLEALVLASYLNERDGLFSALEARIATLTVALEACYAERGMFVHHDAVELARAALEETNEESTLDYVLKRQQAAESQVAQLRAALEIALRTLEIHPSNLTAGEFLQACTQARVALTATEPSAP